ncbi:MAG: HIT family protein [archaeon]|nr:HIT family protein [archaeon]
MDCDSCKYANNKIDLIFETNHWRIFLASDQTYLGRSIVDCKRHASSLSDLSKDEWLDFAEVVKKFEKAIKKSFNADLFNWSSLMNHAYQQKPFNPHVHFHVRPRYEKEASFAETIFKDTNFGKHYDRVMHTEIPVEIRKKIIEKIKKNL